MTSRKIETLSRRLRKFNNLSKEIIKNTSRIESAKVSDDFDVSTIYNSLVATDVIKYMTRLIKVNRIILRLRFKLYNELFKDNKISAEAFKKYCIKAASKIYENNK